VIVNKILQKAHSGGSLITATVLTALGANIVLCDQYMAVVMAGRMYAQAYSDRGLHPKNLSRAVLNAPQLPPLSTLAGILINDLDQIKQTFILTLDDYHVIQNNAIHDLLIEILKHPCHAPCTGEPG
jgi:hypothetical protein